MLCVQPPDLRHQPLLNVSLLTCGLNYAACLEDSDHSGGGSELVIFSSSTPGNFSREECNSVCYGASQRYGGLGARRECLCSTNYEPNRISEAQCSAACTKPHVMKECGWTLAHDVFVVDFAASLPPFPPVSVHSSAHLSILSSVTPVTLSWDFGDLSPRVNATETVDMKTRHKYAVPGRYPVSVTAWAGPKEVCARREVRVTLPPRLELHCPPLTVANQSLAVRLVSWGGEGVAVDWRITKDGQEAARATPYCPRDAVFQCSVTDSSQCFQLVPGEFSWSEARRQCSSTGGDLAVVRTDPLRRRLADRVTQCVSLPPTGSVVFGWVSVTWTLQARWRWVDGSEALEGEGGGRDRATLVRGKVCVSLDHTALPSSHPCSTKRAYVCQYSPQVRVPDAGVYWWAWLFSPPTDLSVAPPPTALLP
ncbi:polycystin-1 [Oncorhynchus kisutch]|uniref:polycystin-1 n=1 Tax=Oncorhynchus kisutch TaxID=8019 RepID=UPI0012DD6A4B|nr:polycystin-1 [Oncorhynchus kisutch]